MAVYNGYGSDINNGWGERKNSRRYSMTHLLEERSFTENKKNQPSWVISFHGFGGYMKAAF